MKKSILQENRRYIFPDYFELANPTKDIVAEFGYIFKLQKLELPRCPIHNGTLEKLRNTFYKKLPHISLNSETAKREFLDVDIDVEYPISIEYWIRVVVSDYGLLVGAVLYDRLWLVPVFVA
jgi:hypothetical protein